MRRFGPAVVVGLAGLAVVVGGAAVFGVARHEDASQVLDLSARVSDGDLARIRLTGGERIDPEALWLTFGFDLRDTPEEDARQYLPFLAYLEEATGYRFDLHFTPRDGALFQELGKGVVDLAAIGAVSYIKANAEYGAVALARGLNRDGKATYRSLIVTAPDSRMNSITDLRGKRLALGSVDSTQGHIIPRMALLEQGLALEDLGRYEFTGSHRACAKALLSGRFDACALQDTLGEALAAAHRVKVLFASKEHPSSGIAASALLPPEVVDRLRRALLDFDPTGRHRDALYRWDRTEMPKGFVAARDDDYRELRDAMRRLALLN